MSLQGVLEQYDANHTAAGEPAPGASYALRELPIESNLYVRNMKSVMNTFNTPDVLASEGRCEFEKAIFINGYHVFFLKKSVVFFSEDGGQQFVLPLDGRPFDVYIEEIAEKVVYVLVAMHSGVHVSLLRLYTSGAVWLDWKYVELPVPTQTIHRVGEHLFTLCYNDCSLQNVSVEMGVRRVADNVVVPIGDAFSTEGDQREYQFSVDLFFKDRTQTGYGRLYRTSFFHSGILLPSYILILSDIDIRLAELDESGSPRVVGVTNEIGKICALSPPPVCRSDGENGLVLVGMTYSTDGTQQTLWGGGWNRSSWMNFLFSTKKIELRPIPDVTPANGSVKKVVSYCCFAQGGWGSAASSSTTLLVEERSSTVHFQSSLLPLHQRVDQPADDGIPILLTSPIQIYSKVIGVGYKPIRTYRNPLEGVFYIYTDTQITQVGKRSSEEVMGGVASRLFLSGYPCGIPEQLSSTETAALLWRSLRAGLSVEDVQDVWDPLTEPIAQSPLVLSPVCHVLTSYWKKGVGYLSELVGRTTFHSHKDICLLEKIRTELELSLNVAHATVPGLDDCIQRREYTFCLTSTGKIAVADVNMEELETAPRTAMSAQSIFLQGVMRYVKYACSLTHLFSVATVAEEVDRLFPSRLHLESLLASPNLTGDVAEICCKLLQTGSPRVVQMLYDRLTLFPKSAQVLIGFYKRIKNDGYHSALEYLLRNLPDASREGLLPHCLAALEKGEPSLLPTLKVLLTQFQMDQRQESLDNLLDHLEKIEQPNALQESLFSIFSMLQSKEATNNEVLNGEGEALSRAILQWMMGHELGDHRLGVFAGVVDRFHLPVHLNEDCMTETFCWCWSEYSSGEKGRASRHLAELATTTGFCPLSIRKKCIDLTLLHTSAVEYQWVAFLLELQQRLYNVIEALSREAYVEPEVLIRLSGHYLGEKQLLETCREYHHVGGAVLELDLLGKQSNVSLPTLHGAISATLNFLCSQSGSPSAAVVSVLETHFHNFQVTLPLIPFVDFYLSQEGKLADLVDLFYQEGVPPQDVFTLLHHMLDTQDKSRNPYPIVEVVQLMVQQVLPKITDNSLRRRYIRHTVGTLEKIDGEYRRFFLTPQELESLEELEREVYQMSEAIQ